MTITQKLERIDGRFVIAISDEEAGQLGIVEGQVVAIEIAPLESQSAMDQALRPEIREAINETWDEDLEAYHYLADR